MKIFLGYPSEHLETAVEIYGVLQSLGHQVWFDKKSLIAGVDWDRERARGQDEADLIIHLCSSEILTRRGVVNREIRQTLRLVDDQPFGALFVIFIRLGDFRLPVELSRFQYVDYFQPEWQGRLREAVEIRASQLSNASSTLLPKREIIKLPDARSSNVIEFSDATEHYECSGNYLAYDRKGLYWTFVNTKLASHVLEEFTNARRDFEDIVSDNAEVDSTEAKHLYWKMTSEEFALQADILSARFYTYQNFGGAHPNHHIRALIFWARSSL